MINEDILGFNAFWWDKLWDEDSVKRVVDILAEIGYKGVEWKETSFNREAGLEKELSRAARISQEGGLTVTDAVILRKLTDMEEGKKNVEEVVNFIKCCAYAGIDKVNIASGGIPLVKDEEKLSKNLITDVNTGGIMTDIYVNTVSNTAWEIFGANLELLVEAAEKNKVYLVIEAVVNNLVHDYSTVKHMLDFLDSPYLCLTFDPSHYKLYNDDVAMAIVSLGKEKIKHVHLKDVIGNPGEMGKDFIFPLLGEGAVEWDQFFEALDEINYEGYLSVEFESWKYMDNVLHNNIPEAARLSMRSARALLNNYYNYKKSRKSL